MYEDLPNEVIEKILLSASPKSIVTCRGVCRKWRENADFVTKNPNLWQKHCETYYSDIWQSARLKSNPDLSWYQLFKALKYWPKIAQATETTKEFSKTKGSGQVNVTFQVLRDELIGVLRTRSVVYYKVNTLQQLHELTINGNERYLDYKENDVLILLYNMKQDLIIRKKETRHEIAARIANVKLFLLLENVIYYTTTENFKLFKCLEINRALTSVELAITPHLVLSLGHENNILYLITHRFEIYSLANNILTLVDTLVSETEKFEALQRFNFANNTDWTDVSTCIKYLHSMSVEYLNLRHLYSVRIYGPIVFATYKLCVVRIFYSLYTTSLFNLLNGRPTFQIFLMPVAEHTYGLTIQNIDVIEGENCHTVIIGKETMITAMKFTHDPFKKKDLQSTENPSLSLAKPSTSRDGQSTSRDGQSTSGDGQSTSGDGQSTSRDGQSTSGDEQLTSEDEQSTNSDGQSSSRDEQSSSNGEPLPKVAKKTE